MGKVHTVDVVDANYIPDTTHVFPSTVRSKSEHVPPLLPTTHIHKSNLSRIHTSYLHTLFPEFDHCHHLVDVAFSPLATLDLTPK